MLKELELVPIMRVGGSRRNLILLGALHVSAACILTWMTFTGSIAIGGRANFAAVAFAGVMSLLPLAYLHILRRTYLWLLRRHAGELATPPRD